MVSGHGGIHTFMVSRREDMDFGGFAIGGDGVAIVGGEATRRMILIFFEQ